MHPVLARYLSLDAALATLDRDARGEPLEPLEQPFAEVARADPERRHTLLDARGRKRSSPEVDTALLVLAAHAATLAVRTDAELGPLLLRAKEALGAEGASPDEADRLLASLVVEEAFGYDGAADQFDRPFFRETLESVPALAKLHSDAVDALVSRFVEQTAPTWRTAHAVAARALLHAAWEEGLEPINPEHVEEALETASAQLGRAERGRALEALRRFIHVLGEEGLLGPLRAARLDQALCVRALTLDAQGKAH